MEPIRVDYSSLLPKLGAQVGQKAGDPDPAVQFDQILQGQERDKAAAQVDASGPAAEVKQVIEDQTHQTAEQIASTTGWNAGAPPATPRDVPPPSTPLHPSIGQGRRGTGQPLPILVPSLYQAPDPNRAEPDSRRMPRQDKRPRSEITVDSDLVANLHAHGLTTPVSTLEDRRLVGEARFDGHQGWVRIGTESSYTATWRSERDGRGTWQRVSVAAVVVTVETCGLDKIQTIEVRGDNVTVTRGPGPRPEFLPR